MNVLMIAPSLNPDLLRTPRQMGLGLILAAREMPPGADMVDVHLPVDEFDEDAVLKTVRNFLARGGTVDAVACFHEGCLHVAARVAAELGLPGNSAEAVRAMRDKHLCGVLLEQHGVPGPRTRLATDLDGLRRQAAEIGYPVVVKPQSSAMSQGVMKVDNEEGLAAAFQVVQRVYEAPGFQDGPYSVGNIGRIYIHPDMRGMVVQEYLTGPEVAVDLVYGAGVYAPLAIHDKPLPFRNHFIEGTYVTPSSLPEPVQRQVVDVAIAALTALDATVGAAHVELRVTAEGPKIIEVNGRLGGTSAFVQESIRESVGVWGPAEYLQVVLGGPPSPAHAHPPRPAGFTPLLAERSGEIAGFHGAAEAAGIPGVRAIRWMNKPGDHVVIAYPANPISCFALVLSTGETREDVLRALAIAGETLHPLYADQV